MKRGIIIGLTMSAIFLLIGTMSFAQLDRNRPELNTIAMDNADEGLQLAHHVGSAPGWMGPDNLEDWNVYGGEYDDTFYPEGNAGDIEPENRPADDPSSGSKNSKRNIKKAETAKAGSCN